MKDRHIEPECYQIIENIKRIRLYKKITIDILSAETGISRSNIFYIFEKRCLPTLNTLVKIAKALNVTLQELTEEIDWNIEMRERKINPIRQQKPKKPKINIWPGASRGWGSITRGVGNEN